LAKLALAILRDFPEHKARFKEARMKIGKRRLRSYNSLLRTFEGADGLKTGFVCASGYNIVASATRNGNKLIAVVLGAKNSRQRAKRATSLLTYGFEYYDWKMLLKNKAGTPQIDRLPLGPFQKAEPANMRPVVCSPRRAVKRKKKRKKKRIRRK
jgi:D-alanyl-D-alanine carboxypeptidase